ncbi:Six-hairpin glycosidase-like protein [Chytridium lagenaria]|nr:Six-hairpin glycosidase-like protein [Chytridium lagenaria]
MLLGALSKLVLVLASAVTSSFGAVTLDVKDPAAIRNAARLGSRWLGYHYTSWGDGAWDQNILHWHESGMYWQTYLEYRKYFGDSQYDTFVSGQMAIASFYDQGDFLDGNSGIQATLQGKWNDDILWWALAAITGAEIWGPDALVNPFGATGEKGRNWLRLVNVTFFHVMEQWDETTCGGGLYWSRDRNSRSKGLQILHHPRPNGTRFTRKISDRLYKWMKDYVIQPDYIIADGVDSLRPGATADQCGTVTPNPWSYQHGALIPGLAVFYNLTKDETYLDEAHKHFDAAHRFFVDSAGIIHDPICRDPQYRSLCNKDPGGFTWAMYRGFAVLYTITPNVTVRNMIERSLENTLLEDIKKCPGTNADWNCVRTLNPVPEKYTFPNGTNPRDQMETIELLTALSVVRGFKPIENNALPPAPAAPAPQATSPPGQRSGASSIPMIMGYVVLAAASAAMVVIAA